MKKKILLISLMIALFACVFAFSVNAELIALDTDPGLNCDDSLVSTFDYDVFNNSTAPDKESRVVMTDGTKFYVFPSFYIISGPSYGYSLTNLNKAIKASDSTVTDDMFTAMKMNHNGFAPLPKRLPHRKRDLHQMHGTRNLLPY